MSKLYAVVCLSTLIATTARAQDIDFSFLPTRAEATEYRESTGYDEVVAFVDILANASERVHRTTFGYSSEGRPLPLAVFGQVRDASPDAVRTAGRTRVFIQANIHAGEVCGKEAALMLLRALAAGRHAAWADSLVILVAPIYNADGNERLSLTNRPRQNGPYGGMGQRPNAQGYDLNRDHMKLDSPEARSLVGLFNAYDPHVVVDLHTTNGTRHAYHLTYSPPLHPNTPNAIDTFLRDEWLPTVTTRIKETYGWDYYYYGNVPSRRMNIDRGWYTFDHRPRFNNNYVGLRNRFAILSEAYAYASFRERVLATLYFLEEILTFAHDQASAIRELAAAAEAEPVVGRPLALTASFKRSGEPVPILMGEVVSTNHPLTGAEVLSRADVQRTESMYEYGEFQATETETAPVRYFVLPGQDAVLDRLAAHGAVFDRLEADTTLSVERFRIDSTRVATREYQGHRAQTVFGAYERLEATLPAGTALVEVAQPLGRLLFSLLEPRSDDGLAAWGLVSLSDDDAYYPIWRAP